MPKKWLVGACAPRRRLLIRRPSSAPTASSKWFLASCMCSGTARLTRRFGRLRSSSRPLRWLS
eukprot:8205340-Alexandrium_andersonii.AAC.1